jgi:hypothetical protein
VNTTVEAPNSDVMPGERLPPGGKELRPSLTGVPGAVVVVLSAIKKVGRRVVDNMVKPGLLKVTVQIPGSVPQATTVNTSDVAPVTEYVSVRSLNTMSSALAD